MTRFLKAAAVLLAVSLLLPFTVLRALADSEKKIDIYFTYQSDYIIFAKAKDESSVIISWEDIPDADRYAVAYYNNEGKRSGIKYLEQKKQCTVGGLVPGGSYMFRLYARVPDETGRRTYVIAAKKITVCAYAAAPAKLSAASVTEKSAKLSWKAAENVSGYELEYLKSGKWTKASDFGDPRKTDCVLSGLTANTSYELRLRAYVSGSRGKVCSRYIYASFSTKKLSSPAAVSDKTEETPDTAVQTQPQTNNISTEKLEILGANMIYVGESFTYKFSYPDGKLYNTHRISWSSDSAAAKASADGKLTALSNGTVTLTVKDETTGAQGSMTVHCVSSAADVDFVPTVSGVPIANKTYPLPSWYDPGLDPDAKAAYDALAADAAKEGLNFFIISSYRSYEKQRSAYNGWVNLYGKEQAERVSARPGYSEHQLGLAIDVNSCYYDFADTAEAKWLAKNCCKYGFILRYPSYASEKITGYAYEPWHIRYLGKELAKKVFDSGLTLEEYLGIDSRYR